MAEHTTAANRLGEVLRDGDRIGVRYERRLAHPPEKVWRALTESEQLQHWFPADMIGDRVEGAELRFKFWPSSIEFAAEEMEMVGVDLEDPVLPGRLLTWNPPRLLEVAWDTERLRYELEPDGANTRLVFTVWLGDEHGPRGVRGTAAGYHVCLDSLAETLDTGTSSMPPMAEITALEEKYGDLLEAT